MSQHDGRENIRITLDLGTLDWIREKLMEYGLIIGLGIVIRELAEENKRLREELKACREQAPAEKS
jgi:hypothetical protein